MLQQLNLRDFVLVNQLTLDFQGGFSALTGETGAGKSILVDAIALILGARTDVSVIREGAQKSIIHAIFSIDSQLEEYLKTKDLDNTEESNLLMLRRVIEKNGKSRAYINETPVPLQTLKEVGEFLVDIHGQHAHQSLLKTDIQRQLLDDQAKLSAEVTCLKTLYQAWQTAQNALVTAQNNLANIAQKKEQLLWQKEELENLAPLENEWENLEAEEKRLSHAEQFLNTLEEANQSFFENDFPIEKHVRQNTQAFENLANLDPSFQEICTIFHSIENELSEIKSFLHQAQNRIHLDPSRLNEVNSRIHAFLQSARKYRIAPNTLPHFYQQTLEELNCLDNQSNLESLTIQANQAQEAFLAQAKILSQKRKQAAQEMSFAITQTLAQLSMEGTRFEVRLQPLDKPAAFGLENVEFYIANGNQSFKPLAKIASGGELSRISLAIEVFSSRAKTVPTLIFDEVDVGIGGAVAEIVGKLLAKIAKNKQILCVTHLPQVAACADYQWKVKKEQHKGQITSQIELLDSQSRIQEIARMLGGVKLTEITLAHAQELLKL